MKPHTKHYYRAGFLLLGGLVSFFIFRAFVIPDSFGQYGFYRGENVEEQMNEKAQFAPKEACADCHAEEWQKNQKGGHANVQCQNCHDKLAVHFDMEKGEFLGKMPMMKDAKLCLRCHLKLPSRPQTQPQIDLEDHLKGMPNEHDPEVCFMCHNPHSPKIGS